MSAAASTAAVAHGDDHVAIATGRKNPLSSMVFGAVEKLIYTGFKRQLQQTDLPALSANNESAACHDAFMATWRTELTRPKPSFARAIVRHFKWPWIGSLVLALLSQMLQVLPAILIRNVAEWVAAPAATRVAWEGWVYLAVIFASSFIGSLLWSHSVLIMVRCGVRIRSTMISAIYRKTLKLSPHEDTSSGQILNLMSNDSQRLVETFQWINLGVVSPITLIVVVGLLINLLGAYALIGLAVFIVLTPVNGIIAKKFGVLRAATIRETDKRVQLENELFGSMRPVKFYAWENAMFDVCRVVREQELGYVKSLGLWRAIMMLLMNSSPTIVAVTTFLAFTYGEPESFTPAVMFAALSLFDVLRVPITILPMVISILAQNKVSLDRTQAYLDAPEMQASDPDVYSHNTEPTDEKKHKDAVRLEKLTSEWHGEHHPAAAVVPKPADDKKAGKKAGKKGGKKGDDAAAAADKAAADKAAADKAAADKAAAEAAVTPFSLVNVDVRIKRGALALVVGPVGSGKSSLLSAILNEMSIKSGKVTINGRMAYVPQTAWIVNATVRDNIVFSRTFDETRYNRVLDACGLRPDLALLVAGDATEIGERGINLSGGQKQRISIARAAYGDEPIVLLDDPLSAVDAHVGEHIFNEVLLGALGDRTRIMTTNQLQYLQRCDTVIVLRDGRVAESGKYADLVKSGLDFAALMREFGLDATDEADAAADAAAAAAAKNKKKKASTSAKVGSAPAGAAAPDKGAIITKETRDEGLVSLALYWRMGRLAGSGWMLALILFSVLATAAKVISDWWLSQWTAGETLRVRNVTAADASSSLLVPLLDKDEFLWAYVGIGVGEIIFSSAVGFAMVWFALNVSRGLHDGMLRSLLRAPMSFFDQTPIGRISNRFSFDLDLVDFRLPFLLQQYIVLGLRTIGVLVVVSFTSYYTVIGCVAIAIVYYLVTNYYRHTAIELQRLESTSRSPIFAHFIETLQGISSVRAYGQEAQFLAKNDLLLNKNVQALYTRFYAASWLQMRLGLLGSLVTLIVMLIAIFADIQPDLVALTLTYAVSMTQLLSQLSRQATDTETHMNGVERTLEYSKLPEEAPAVVPHVDDALPAGWPRTGKISFKNVTMRYRPELDPVLRNVSFDIADGERVAIVGRTGSGKSSLLNVLMRIVEIEPDGSIEIDGVDTRTVGLRRLRRAMAIIPQDPVLFTNTVRYNIDPFNEHTDAELWDALRLARLDEHVRSLEGGLEHHVLEGGENFSVGQRQLLCVARALVRKPKILLLDEASAGIDMHTDELLQTMIREEFRDSTIVGIAHRLQTIIDYSSVVVLDHGRLAEHAPPGALLEGPPTGVFASLVDATGAKSSRRLRQIASEHYAASKRGQPISHVVKTSRPITAATIIDDEESANTE